MAKKLEDIFKVLCSNDNGAIIDGSKRRGELEKLLNRAYTIRDFEIQLFWQRALYFWGFIAGAFTAFFTVNTGTNSHLKLIIACLGLILSFAWYLINRASTHWKENWEAIIDLLEKELKAPLYRLVIVDSTSEELPEVIFGRKHYRISKINTVMCVVICITWGILIISYLLQLPCFSFLNCPFLEAFKVILVLVATLISIRYLYTLTESPIMGKETKRKYKAGDHRILYERTSEVVLEDLVELKK